MRDIKFRAQDTVGNWIYVTLINVYPIKMEYYHNIGQYIGSKDENGEEIYEGDIVLSKYSKRYYTVEFRDGGFWFMSTFKEGTIEFPRGESFTVVGNIYDNPGLLE